MPKVALLMANYGHDPTETAIPYHTFKDAGFSIDFVTEAGNIPECDARMLTGMTQKLLGATQEAISAYHTLQSDLKSGTPRTLAWSSDTLTLNDYDLIFLPGGHVKTVVQLINSPRVHQLLASYFPQTRKPSRKCCAAICHGVMALSETSLLSDEEGGKSKSVLHDATTTALPGAMEQSIFWATRLWLGDYYKTYGAGSESVETSVRKRLDHPTKQWYGSLGMKPFVREDERYNYISGRFPPDAQLLAESAVKMVKNATGEGQVRV